MGHSRYLNMYRCMLWDCGWSVWAFRNPRICEHCGGPMQCEKMGTEPVDDKTAKEPSDVPSALAQMTEKQVLAEIERFWQGFDQWRDDGEEGLLGGAV